MWLKTHFAYQTNNFEKPVWKHILEKQQVETNFFIFLYDTGPPTCGFWIKFVENSMETAHRNVAAVGRNRGARKRDSAPIGQTPHPSKRKKGIRKKRG